MGNKIFISVDMDEWYQCRWATGSKNSLWSGLSECFQAHYKSDRPIGEIIPATEKILELFHNERIQGTFFFTGTIARFYPNLLQMVTTAGHEIGCHHMHHRDFGPGDEAIFRQDLLRSKMLLEDMSGRAVIGYRAPNSTVCDYMIPILIESGFRYDSSITPTRPLWGKFGKFQSVPRNPYQLSEQGFATVGTAPLWEFPWPVFPLYQLPSGSAITLRLMGYHYTRIALDSALKSGHTSFYLHPYEIGNVPRLQKSNLKSKIFLKNVGKPCFAMVVRLLKNYRDRFISGEDLYNRLEAKP